MKVRPSLSVCIPVYNAGKYLEPAIESVLAQDYDDFELIVVDDNSKERTESTIEGFRDTRLRFMRNEENLGLPANWNRCIGLATGSYISIFHQDDLMLPSNLRKKIDVLNNNPEIGFVYSDIITIDDSGKIIGGHYIHQPDSDRIMPGSAVFEMASRAGNPIACPSVIVRAKCYEKLGVFDSHFPFATDLEMWLRIAGRYSIGYINEPLVAHRIHQSQEGARFRGTGRDYMDNYRVLNTVYSTSLPPNCANTASLAYKTLAAQSLAMARWRLRMGQPQNAWRYTLVALMSLTRAGLRHLSPSGFRRC